MSKLTPCNYCILQQIKKTYPGKEVDIRKVDSMKICNLQVFVDGKGIGVWFAAITDHCCC